jgi:hypothetical protein
MEVLSEEIVYASYPAPSQQIPFSPLDLFAGGHLPVGPLYGFRGAIDSDRFRLSLQIALSENPEMGVAIHINEDGIHVMETGNGIELVVQRCDEPMPAGEAVPDLPLDMYPLAYSALTSFDLVDRKLPLLGFRITYFADGGCILGIRTTHSHLDGAALTQILLNLSAIYHGDKPHPPLIGRSAVEALAGGPGLHPSIAFPVAPGHTDTALFFAEHAAVRFEASRTPITTTEFSRYKAAVERDNIQVTSSDLLNAIIWKAWSRIATARDEEASQLYGVFNLRGLPELGIPHHFQGNALLDRAAHLTFGEVRKLPITDIALAYRRQIKPLKAQEIRADIAYLARLQRERCYGKDGTLNGFQRNLYVDLFKKSGLFINDMRLLEISDVRFGDRACWFEQGQGHAQGFVALSQQQDNIIIRYDGAGEETARFVTSLREILAQELCIA